MNSFRCRTKYFGLAKSDAIIDMVEIRVYYNRKAFTW